MECGKLEIVGNRVIIAPANSTVWMTKHEITDLFGCFVAKVVSNIPAILKSGVLDESRVCRCRRYNDGGSIELYNLEMIIALSFRIKSRKSEILRCWLIERITRQEKERQFPIFISYGCDTPPN